MSNIIIGIGWIILTVLLYQLSKKIYQWLPTPFTVPMLVATALMIVLLLVLDIPYQQYMQSGGGWIAKLLGPGVVAFAIPLYKQREVLKKYVVPIAGGVLVGTTVAIASDLVIATLMGTDKSLILSSLPKSVTMPVAMSVSEQVGGIPSLTAAFVVVAGVTGTITGPLLLKWSRVTNSVGKGIGFGCASHIMGVMRAMKNNEHEGVIGSVTMTLTAILTCLLGPLFATFFM
ncbi:LrgB family protein [Bacillus sp. DX1.1]|uniref:LrgB family protein n=1 Tax=unclassified Bacillus (in: firmicutes) TaxID=185979 RepID=UPI0025712FCF|nr:MULTISPECIES: LrgB family protein [unclassified Bacillus (in: firmicutes)]MDM5157198.1 LrgB family protein [Bacillus sp. DX1.1]WJE81429.1 LrgB family protein [Bacillus sp. DX3.1]